MIGWTGEIRRLQEQLQALLDSPSALSPQQIMRQQAKFKRLAADSAESYAKGLRQDADDLDWMASRLEETSPQTP